MDSIAQCHCQFNFEASQRQFPGPSQSLVEEYKSRNKYPLLHEADSIRAEMEGAKGQEALLSEKIASLRSTITFLTDERARVRRQIGDYRWILRPVHKLPPELLERIFSFTLNPSASEDPFQASSSLHPSGMPWVLAQVCQSWRNLALSTPSLWKHVMLSFPSRAMDQSNLQAQIYRLNSQLHRSEDHPLEVITSTRYSTKDTEPLLILLCSQSRRWRTLKIELEDKDAHTFSLIRGSLPLLESLHIYCIERLQSIFDCFEFVPRLRSLTLSGEYIANAMRSAISSYSIFDATCMFVVYHSTRSPCHVSWLCKTLPDIPEPLYH
ncbi:hypothetical protein L218DRAFT_336315 [Marasmius fiardii PR-910]|nr:hypothetical protein L218DRAFT_336315 [Marasmius fiardii PR-910]